MTLPNLSNSEGSDSLLDRVARIQDKPAPSQLSRIWNIAKYYRKTQLARRAFSIARNKLGFGSTSQLKLSADQVSVRAQSEFATISKIRAATCFRLAEEVREQLSKNEIAVLNSQRPLEWRIDKSKVDASGHSLLWQFQLHYHEYLLPLLDTDKSSDVELIENVVRSWIDANPATDSNAHVDAWHPYCISRRLPVWFCLATSNRLAPDLVNRIRQSAHAQAEFLSSNLEWDLRGNHLLENLRALALAGCFFESRLSDNWLKQVRSILPTQINEQVLSHGEHFERCPMYHCQILGNFLEMMIGSQNVDQALHRMLRPAAEKMFGFLIDVVHPDGEIPLLGDSCFGEAPNVNCIGQLADAAGLECSSPDANQTTQISKTGDYWIYREQNDYLVFDRGPAGAQQLPAHAHCDLLTIESSIGGTRWLVDSGIFNYEDDPMRWYCRSSLAHNVVHVADQNQFDVWSKFRMGYRGWPSDHDNGQLENFSWATAAHNAFRRLGVDKTSRLIGIENGKFWYCVDRVSNPIAGLAGMLHLGPDVRVTEIESTSHMFRLEIGDVQCEILFSNVAKVEIVNSWYCPEFGRRIPNIALEYTFLAGTNCAGWLLIPPASTLRNGTLDDSFANGLPRFEVERQNQLDQISISTSSDDIIHTFSWKHS